jgi:phage regulator Rha-like protein
MLFVNNTDKKELLKALIKDQEENVRFNEKLIECYQEMEKRYAGYPDQSQEDIDKTENYRKMIREWEGSLQLARSRLVKTKRQYDEINGGTGGLTLAQGEICNDPLTSLLRDER